MELPEKILSFLDKTNEPVESEALANEFKEDHQKIVGAIKSLESLGNLIETEMKTVKQWQLSSEGQIVVKRGSHEALVYFAVPENGSGISQKDLTAKVGPEVGKIGFSKALQQRWIMIDKNHDNLVKRKVDSIDDKVHKDLSLLIQESQANVPEKSLAEYKKRKLVEEKTIKR